MPFIHATKKPMKGQERPSPLGVCLCTLCAIHVRVLHCLCRPCPVVMTKVGQEVTQFGHHCGIGVCT